MSSGNDHQDLATPVDFDTFSPDFIQTKEHSREEALEFYSSAMTRASHANIKVVVEALTRESNIYAAASPVIVP